MNFNKNLENVNSFPTQQNKIITGFFLKKIYSYKIQLLLILWILDERRICYASIMLVKHSRDMEF